MLCADPRGSRCGFPLVGLGRLQGGGGISPVLPRLDVSEMRRIAEEGAMWAKAGEPGRLFRALGRQSVNCVLGIVKPGIRSDRSKAATGHLQGRHPHGNHSLGRLSRHPGRWQQKSGGRGTCWPFLFAPSSSLCPLPFSVPWGPPPPDSLLSGFLFSQQELQQETGWLVDREVGYLFPPFPLCWLGSGHDPRPRFSVAMWCPLL